MSDKTTISEALAAVMADVDHVAKRDVNQHQRFIFRGVDAVVNAVGPALRRHGVSVRPTATEATYETVQTSTGKPSTACRVTVTYTFRGPDGGEVSTTVAGEAWDSGDKATPKAMSVAFRTALLQALCLPTDEPDPDHSTYERAETPRDVILRHHQGDFNAAITAAAAAGFDNLRDPQQLAGYATHLTGAS